MSNEKLARGRAENTARLRRWAESVLAMPAGHHDEDVIAAAAPDLAETVAGLRYEYAVQVKRGYWRYDSLLGGWTTRPEYAKWLLDLDEVEGAAEFWGKRYKTRVMRRLVTDPEVAE